MSELSRSLRRELAGEFPNGNPLVTFGISVQVLDLGLTQDELFHYITRDVARRLLMRVHPDRAPSNKRPDIQILQKKYAEAYEQLQDRELFDKALDEFRDLKAEERSETRILRTALYDTRMRLESYRMRELEIEGTKKQLELDRKVLRREKLLNAKVVPSLEDRAEKAESGKERIKSMAFRRKKKYEDVLRYALFLCDDHFNTGVYFPKAKWVAFATFVPGHARRVPLPSRMAGKWTPEFLEAIKPLGLSDQVLAELFKKWKDAVKRFHSPTQGKNRRTYNLRMTVLELSYGQPKVLFGYDEASAFGKGRVIGSIPHAFHKFDRRYLVDAMLIDDMFEHLLPFLNVGNLLVSATIRKITSYPADRRPFPQVARETRRLILGVG